MEQQYSIPIEPKVYAQLEQESLEEHRDKSEIVNDLIRRHFLVKRTQQIREKLAPIARAKGYLTEEDIFSDVS